MSLWDVFKVKKIGINVESLFSTLAGKQLRFAKSFNKWDEQWEPGIILPATGEAADNWRVIRAKHYIPCLPSTNYYFRNGAKSPMNICFYDADKTFISGISSATSNTTRTTPDTCYFIRFSCGSAYGTEYLNDICINISSDRNGEYQPYGRP